LLKETKEDLFSFPKDDRKECVTMERDFLLPSMAERWLRAKLERLFDSERERFWESVGDEIDALVEIGTVREDEVRRLAGHDSVVRVDSLTDAASESRPEFSMTMQCVRPGSCGGEMMMGGGMGKGGGESGRKSTQGELGSESTGLGLSRSRSKRYEVRAWDVGDGRIERKSNCSSTWTLRLNHDGDGGIKDVRVDALRRELVNENGEAVRSDGSTNS
jgi:hypothetical protein